MLFIVFDIEIVFLYPLAVILHQLAWFGFVEFLFFIVILGSRTSTSGGRGRSSGSRDGKKRLADYGLQSERVLWPARARASSSRRSATSSRPSG